jgi:hypothetical protein
MHMYIIYTNKEGKKKSMKFLKLEQFKHYLQIEIDTYIKFGMFMYLY